MPPIGPPGGVPLAKARSAARSGRSALLAVDSGGSGESRWVRATAVRSLPEASSMSRRHRTRPLKSSMPCGARAARRSGRPRERAPGSCRSSPRRMARGFERPPPATASGSTSRTCVTCRSASTSGAVRSSGESTSSCASSLHSRPSASSRSPLLAGDCSYVRAGGGLVKLQKSDGSTVWRTLEDGGGMNGSASSPPVLATLQGARQLLVQTRQKLENRKPRCDTGPMWRSGQRAAMKAAWPWRVGVVGSPRPGLTSASPP